MLTEILQYLRNWFEKTKYYGVFEIEDGSIVGMDDKLVNGQYIRIIGSAMNDGVWKYPSDELQDEVFDGAVWGLALPPAVAALSVEIADWQTINAEAVSSPYQSESFGGYSYSKASGGADADGGASWQTVFKSRLSPWRKI